MVSRAERLRSYVNCVYLMLAPIGAMLAIALVAGNGKHFPQLDVVGSFGVQGGSAVSRLSPDRVNRQ